MMTIDVVTIFIGTEISLISVKGGDLVWRGHFFSVIASIHHHYDLLLLAACICTATVLDNYLLGTAIQIMVKLGCFVYIHDGT